MRKVPFFDSLHIIGRGSMNWSAGRPICVSFEVTDSCTCHCRHCDHGGARDNSRNLKPADYRRYMKALRPCIVQVSGGEPLLRKDVVEIVRNIKQDSGIPYILFMSNWSLMTVEKYLELRAAGVDQFNVSLDFPDARHDDFRKLPGLYARLEKLVPRLAALGHDDIVLNCCITSANLAEINRLADKAKAWGVNLVYSSYSARRTGCRDYSLTTPSHFELLKSEFDQVETRRDATNFIVSSPATLSAMRRFFEHGGTPGCKAGHRFLVVTSDGWLQPCSMVFERYPLHERARMVEDFTKNNRCDECYVAIRANLDKTFPRLLWENVSEFLSAKATNRYGSKRPEPLNVLESEVRESASE